jgi:hypothetical protein
MQPIFADPTGENNPSAQLAGFLCQNHENRLCNLLGVMRIAGMTQAQSSFRCSRISFFVVKKAFITPGRASRRTR